ncbi:MAG: hypothetical protein QNJ72_42550 [Pleurocapsa sp. MO_226.B13]|nr:hypothetical protein [Pleurocapsa sp. MO_226.B13]
MTTYRQTNSLKKLPSVNKRPQRYKLFLLTWLAIYPLITIILHFFGRYLSLLPLPIRTLVLTGILVYLMTYWVMPMLMKLFRNWLNLN